MRSLQRIFAVLLLVAIGYAAEAQYCGHIGFPSGPNSTGTTCTAGNSMTLPGFSPPDDSVPCIVQGVYYSTIVQVKVPTTVTSGGTTYPLNWIKIDSVGNLPCGLCWNTNKATNQFNGNEQFCIHIFGTSYDNIGEFKLKIIVDANVTAFGFPITQSNQDASAAGLRFFARVQAPGGICAPVDTLAAGNTAIATGPAPSSAVTAGGPLAFCTGGSVVLTATETGAVYQWYNGTTLITGATSRTYTATGAGSYTVNVIKNCVGVVSAAKVVTINPSPTVSLTPVGPVILCGGSTQVLTATASGGTLQWYNGAGAISGQTATTYTATATGTYYAIATLSGCTGTSNSVSVQISGTPPTPTITLTSAGICPGNTDTMDAGAGYTSYAWSNGLGSGQKAYATAAGNYSVTVTNGVCSGVGTVAIALNNSPATPSISPAGTVAICQGDSVTLTSTGASTYSWSNGAHTQSITVGGGGPYTVTITVVNQCGTASSPAKTVTVNARPNAAITPSTPVIICGSGSQTFTATGSGTYQWLNNNLPISGQTASTYTATAAGNYSVVVTSNGCLDTSNVVNVQIGSALSPTITANHTYICTGATDTLDVGSGYSTYAWSNSLGSARFAYPTSAGTYTVTVTTGACSGTATVTLNAQAATPTPTISAGGPTTFCTGGSVVLTSSAASGNAWSNSANTQAITVTTSGSYTVTNNNGCGAATSQPTTVTVNTIPNAQITPSGSTIICGGSTQVLTATPAGASYVWQNGSGAISGQTAATYSATATGTYSAVVTVNGCSATSNTATITVSGTPPTPTITATAQTLCPGVIDTLDVGSGYTSYAWNGSLGTSSNATVTSGGTYTVTVHNGVCVGTATITITQGVAATTPTISVQGNLHICGADSVILTSSSATGNTWSNTATSQSITVYGAGVFNVTVNGGCGIATSLSDTVTANTFPQVQLGADTGKCAGDSISLNAGTDGTTYLWSNGVSTSLNSVTTTSEYYVSVTKNGCINVDSIHVTFDAVPSATFTQSNGVLTASAGTTYQWKRNGADIIGATSQIYDANPSGTANYAVVVTVGYCSAASTPQLVTIIGISELAQSLNTNIYPNPTNKEITIAYTLSRNEVLDVYITDVTGRIINNLHSGAQADGEHKIVTDLAGLTGGVYFVNFRTAEGTVVRKIVKE
ncbi:MAG: hypothetical protein JWO03_456 [Bacteroidetes bacterium]|nr:hypothetical protein [Bacteroidota bacterium]